MNRTVGTGQSVSCAVTCAVSEMEERAVTDLPPLYETVDVDALESLVCSETGETPEFDGCMMFEYSDSQVAIWIGSSVTVAVSSTSKDRLKEDWT